jgi:5-(carboxyamino)imidazole ribonucleotide synthase
MEKTTDDSNIQRIGVIGGGQLAWMMGPAARSLGLDLVVQTPADTDPAVAVAAETVLAAVADVSGTRELSARCDVITFENEFIDCEGLQALANQGVMFRPGLDVLALVLDKLNQRQCFAHIGLPNPPYRALAANASLDALTEQAHQLGFPVVMKTRRLGYDGYGTFIVKTAEQLNQVWQGLNRPAILLEAFVPFKQELAVMVARSATGDLAVYPTVETQQVNQICRRVIAPARVTEAVNQAVQTYARTLANELNLVGIVGMECFLTPDDRVLINEIAPRTHNSGHYTLDACQTSQFEQQLRAVSQRPLGPTTMTCQQAVMVNLLGIEATEQEYGEKLQRLRAIPQAHLYWYNKAPRPGRKLGHLTLTATTKTSVTALIQQVEAIWYGNSDE